MISFSPCIVIRETFLSSLVSLWGFLISCARYAIQMAWCWRKMICSIIRNFKLITLVGNDERWKRNFSLIIYSTVHNDYKAPIKCVYGSFRVCAYYRSGCVFVLNYDFIPSLPMCLFSIRKQSHGQDKWNVRAKSKARVIKCLLSLFAMNSNKWNTYHITGNHNLIE